MFRALLSAFSGWLICYLFASIFGAYFLEYFEVDPWVTRLADWHGFAASLLLAAICSGLTVALLSLDRLQLQHATEHGDADASKVLSLRQDANRLLATLIWTNVLAMTFAEIFLARQMHGPLHAFVAIFVITIVGELIPIALLTRYGLRLSGPLAPAVMMTQRIMWPVAKPSALVLDYWIGRETLVAFGEHFILWILRSHSTLESSEISPVGGTIAANGLRVHQFPVANEGEVLDKKSIIAVKYGDEAALIAFLARANKQFLRRLYASRKRWAILTFGGKPRWVLDVERFITSHTMDAQTDVVRALHAPLVIEDSEEKLGFVLQSWEVHLSHPDDDRIHHDVALVWPKSGGGRRIITGTDILGLLTRGVVKVRVIDTEA